MSPETRPKFSAGLDVRLPIGVEKTPPVPGRKVLKISGVMCDGPCTRHKGMPQARMFPVETSRKAVPFRRRGRSDDNRAYDDPRLPNP